MSTTDVTLKLLLLGEDRSASRSLKQVGADAQTASKHTGKLHGALKLATGAIAGAVAFEGFRKGADFIKESVDAARESQKVNAQTAAVLKSTGGAAGVTATQIGNLATAISNKTGVDDEAIQSGENLLLTFTNIRNEAGKGNDIFTQSTKIVTDMSAALGQDMKSSAIQVGKALNDPIKGVTALQRVGVSFTAQQKDQIKALVQSGHTMKAQKLILRELNKEFGGSAAAMGTNTDKLKVAFGNFQEQLGGLLIPIIDKVAGFLTTKVLPALMHFMQGMQDGTGAGGKLAARLKSLWQVIRTVVGWLVENRKVLLPLVAGFLSAVAAVRLIIAAVRVWRTVQLALDLVLYANPIGLVVAALAALAAGFVYAYKHSETFRRIVNGVWKAIEVAAKFMWNYVLKPIFTLWATEFRIVWDAAKKLASIIKGVWNVISSAFRAGVRFVVNVFLNLVGAILNGAAKAFGWVPKLGDKLRTAADHFNRFKDRVNRSLSNIHDQKVTVSVGTDTTSLIHASTSILRGRLHKHGPRLATGGHVRGPGTGTSDSIVARLSNGEFVVNARATSKHRGLLEHINRGYAAGGLVVGDRGIPAGEQKVARYASSTNSFLTWFAHKLHKKLDNPFAAAIGVAGQALGALTGGLGASGGVMRWLPVILAVLRMFGLSKRWASAGLRRMMVESGGNPTIVNRWDSNWQAGHPSVGLMQVIRGTFQRYAGPYRHTGPFLYGVSVNPLANVYAGVNYALHNYGVPFVGGTQGYYRGGRPRVGTAALVGEYGPELYVPDSPGRVVTASSGRGGADLGTVAVNLKLDGRTIQTALLKLKRTNGGLSLGLA